MKYIFCVITVSLAVKNHYLCVSFLFFVLRGIQGFHFYSFLGLSFNWTFDFNLTLHDLFRTRTCEIFAQIELGDKTFSFKLRKLSWYKSFIIILVSSSVHPVHTWEKARPHTFYTDPAIYYGIFFLRGESILSRLLILVDWNSNESIEPFSRTWVQIRSPSIIYTEHVSVMLESK